MGKSPNLAAAAAVLAALDLTIGISRRATVHASLGQQFAQLEIKLSLPDAYRTPAQARRDMTIAQTA